MGLQSIGIITNGAHGQAEVNASHAAEIQGALKSHGFKVNLYDLSNAARFDRFVKDVRKKKIDIVFNNSSGKQGGDGSVEGLMELLDIPFVGSGSLATAIAFDKKTTKAVASAAGIPTPKGIIVTEEAYQKNGEAVLRRILKKVKLPLIVKASRGSDSIGVSLVKEENQLVPALQIAFREDSTIIVENFVRRSAEVTCMVIGTGTEATALPVVERVFDTDILYPITISKRTYRFPKLPEFTHQKIQEYALQAHRALGCADYSRSDFIVGKKGGVYFLELNAHAGLGNSGPTAYVCKHSKGLEYEDMILTILESARQRYNI